MGRPEGASCLVKYVRQCTYKCCNITLNVESKNKAECNETESKTHRYREQSSSYLWNFRGGKVEY